LKVKDFTYHAEFPVLNMTIKGNKAHSVAINLEWAAGIRRLGSSSLSATVRRTLPSPESSSIACSRNMPARPVSTLVPSLIWPAQR